MKKAVDLTEQLKTGNQEALFSLMEMYYNDLFRYGIKFTADKDLAKDIVSQFFIHLWDKREQFIKANNLQGYILVSFRHYIINYLQRIQKQLDLQSPATETWEYSYEEYLIAAQDHDYTKKMLQEAITSLPDRQRQLVQLRFYDQLSYEEIADKTTLSLRTVYNKIHIALKTLRSHATVEHLRRR